MKVIRKALLLFFIPCNIIFFFSFSAYGKTLSLKETITKSLQTDLKKIELNADTNIEWLGFIPSVSPWQTDIDASFERLWSRAEEATGEENSYNAFNFDTKVTQRTPYGLSLNVNFQQLLNVPNVDVFLSKELISANLLLSLYNDFLGSKTKNILNIVNDKKIKVFNQKNLISSCEQIANQFFQTFLNEKNFLISKDAIQDIEFIQRRLSKKSISSQDYLSLSIDRAQLDNQIAKSKQQFQTSQLLLSELTRLNVGQLESLSLSEDINSILAKQSTKIEIVDRINLEISILRARKSFLDINQNNDISFFVGHRSQETLPFNTTNSSEIVGLSVKWNFGNEQLRNSKKSIDFEISKRQIQRDHIVSQQETIIENFNQSLRNQAKVLQTMKKADSNAKKLQALSKRSFLNGRIGFFEFLTFRNQANSVKNEYIQTLIDFYKIILEQSVYFGDFKAACFLKNKVS